MDNSERTDDGLIKIGELYDGRHTPKRWVPITRNRRAPQPYPPASDSWKRSDTKLWAGIASFRDSLCGQTLFNMFSKAAYPERITAGVVQQNEEEDESCMKSYCDRWAERGEKGCPYRENIRVLELSASEAQGPCWGRHMQSYLLADEEFCMQTDSHMDFLQNWDTLMMVEWAATRNEYGVLSTYVQDVTKLGVNVNNNYEVSHLCEVLWNAQPRNQQARAIHAMKEPKLTTTWGAGYSFSKCHAERAVPYDPYLHKIFDGEEFSKMLRLWTNGYDVYTPSRGYVGHDYSHHEPKRISWWGNGGKKSTTIIDGEEQVVSRDTANQRLWDLMEMPGHAPKGSLDIQLGPWGLGDKRTLDQFIEFTGANLRSKTYIGETGDRCGSDVEWVPYDRDGPKVPGELDRGGPPHLRGPSADTATSADPCPSWRTREGKDPIDVGPYWDKVQRILEESGIDVWWSPHKDEPLSREAPQVVPDRSSEGGPLSARSFADIREALRGRDTDESGPELGFPSQGVVDGDGDGPVVDATLGELGQRLPGGPGLVGKVSDVQSISVSSWVMMLGVVFVAMAGTLVGIHEYGRLRASKRKKRRRRSRRSDVRIDVWADKAFSTGSISPLGVTPVVWPTTIRKNR